MLDNSGYLVPSDSKPPCAGIGEGAGIIDNPSLSVNLKTHKDAYVVIGFNNLDLQDQKTIPAHGKAILSALKKSNIPTAVIPMNEGVERGEIVVIVLNKEGF